MDNISPRGGRFQVNCCLIMVMKILIGKKLKMTRIFDKDGVERSVTAVEAKPAEVLTIIDESKSGYNAVKVKIQNRKKIKMTEFRTDKVASDQFKVGEKLEVSSFAVGDKVIVVGKSKGKGFAGAIKRHGFSSGPQTHGSGHHRRVGSIGSMFPQHVLKGQKMPGRMGNDRVTVKNLEILDVDPAHNIILISGAIPGSNGSEVMVSTK